MKGWECKKELKAKQSKFKRCGRLSDTACLVCGLIEEEGSVSGPPPVVCMWFAAPGYQGSTVASKG